MASSAAAVATPRTFPVILIAALIQGSALYGLHLIVRDHFWTATDSAWLFGLYAAALFTPITVQMLAEQVRDRILWSSVGAMCAAFFYFGWHYGAHGAQEVRNSAMLDNALQQLIVPALLWLLALPFLQCRLVEGTWRPNYQTLFAAAWRNKLTLAEAGVFTGLFWMLLGLWAALFQMLDIDFFRKLFTKPIFIYPVTALVFGFALYMIGSLTRWVTVVLEQVLNVLKWLAVIAGLILALFTVALAAKLPSLVESGARAIAASWLLWLTAVMVLFVNAAYRDGQVERPYPRWIGLFLRAVLPLLVIIVLTASYAMYLRIDAYGLTVSRFWGCVVAAAACIYAAGYAFVAVRGTPWMAGIERINIGVALFLIAVIALMLTPVLSPYRLAANSQFQRVLRAPEAEVDDNRYYGQTNFEYLRFSSGSYGRARLAELAEIENHPQAEQIRRQARVALASTERNFERRHVDHRAHLAAMLIYPEARTLEPELMDMLIADLQPQIGGSNLWRTDIPLHGLYIDLNEDGVEEFVLLTQSEGLLYAHGGAHHWLKVGTLQGIGGAADLLAAIKAGDIKTVPPKWRELDVGSSRFLIRESNP